MKSKWLMDLKVFMHIDDDQVLANMPIELMVSRVDYQQPSNSPIGGVRSNDRTREVIYPGYYNITFTGTQRQFDDFTIWALKHQIFFKIIGTTKIN